MEIDTEIEAYFKLATDGKQTLDDIRKQLELLNYMPFPTTKNGSAVADSTASAVISFGSPSLGRVWSVVGITVVSTSDHTAVAGTSVAVYVGNPNNRSLSNLVLPGSSETLPFYSDWNKDQLFVNAQDQLFCVVYGLTEGDAVSGNARVLDYNRSNRWQGI